MKIKNILRNLIKKKNRWDKIREIVKTKSNDDIIQMTRYLSINPHINIDGDINLGNLLKKEIKKDTEKKERYSYRCEKNR